ncbi:MAG: hypothetical protein ACYSO3_02150, partial [Planctomycetota bacterium]
ASLVIVMFLWGIVSESRYKRKAFYYDAFVFWQKCKKEGKTDLQAATERYQIVHKQPYFRPEMHPDVKSGHPEAFIRGTLGYELWDGFGYGKKPSRITTLFEKMTVQETIDYMRMFRCIPIIAILLFPIIGGLICYVVAKARAWYSGRTC